MIREVDLVSYLPRFVAEYQELNAALEAENREFVLVWKAADRVLQNQFIESADEFGISRFEKILHILPAAEDTMESRRAKVRARWFDKIPYTLKMLIEKLTALCGSTDFIITKDYADYRITIQTSLDLFLQVEELERIVREMMPCNMKARLQNQVTCSASGGASAFGSVYCVEQNTITGDFNKQFCVYGVNRVGAGMVTFETFEMKI